MSTVESSSTPTPKRMPAPSLPLDLAEVYREHADFVWRTIRRFGVDDDAVEDVLHEVFLVVQRKLHDYDGRASVKSWLYGISRRVSANWRRSRRRAERRERESPLDELMSVPPQPEEHASRRQAAGLVRRFLSSLDDDKRAVFELCDIEGCRRTEAAELLGIEAKLVYSRLRSARLRFQAFCETHAEGGGE